MNIASPRARGVRTFLAALAGYGAAWATVDWATDYRAGATLVTLNVIAAALTGVVAYLLALGAMNAATPAAKAIATFAQTAAAGIATLAVAELTTFALTNFVRGLTSVVVASVLAGFATLAQNLAEGTPEA